MPIIGSVELSPVRRRTRRQEEVFSAPVPARAEHVTVTAERIAWPVGTRQVRVEVWFLVGGQEEPARNFFETDGGIHLNRLGVAVPASSIRVRVPPGATQLLASIRTEADLDTRLTADFDDDAPPARARQTNSVTFDADQVASATAAASIGVSLTVAANTDRCLIGILNCSQTASGRSLTSATWGADAMTEHFDSEAAVATYFQLMACAYLVAAAAATRTLTFNIGGGNATEISAYAVSLYDVDQTTPLNAQQISSGTSATPPASGCTGTVGGMAIGAAYIEGAAITPRGAVPSYISVGTASQSNGATSLTPTSAPAGRVIGDVELCSFANENNAAITVTGAGWTLIGSIVQQDATWQQGTYYRIYDGTNVDPAFSWTGSVGCSARRWLCRDATAATVIGAQSSNSGSGATHSITGQNSTANNSLHFYVSHAEANTALAADADYTERFDAGSATGPYRLVVGDRQQTTSGAGAADFSATGANASWVMRLIEMMAGTAQTQRRETQNVGAFASMSYDTEPGAAYITFGWTEAPANWRAFAVHVNEAVGGGATIRNRTPFLTHIADNPIFQSRVIN